MGDLGRFIREQRELLGLTQMQLADLVGVSHQMISQYELGQARGMNAIVARRLARALEVSTDDILDRMPVPA